MSTGPNQILVKRSDSAGVQPSGLSFGEPAINSADGKLFFSQQTNGTPSGDLWEFRGFTNEGFVASVNGSTGDITVSDIQVVGVSDINGNAVSGETFANTNELSFNSLTPGLTLSASQTANKTLITWDALDIASRIGVLSTSWTYTSAADITIPSTGNIRHQTGLSRLLIHQVDSGGSNTRTTWATVRDDIENYGTSIIRLSFGDDERNYTVNAASYSSPVWTFTISDGNSQTGGGGKSVNAGGYVNPGQNTRMSASEFYRFPDGTTTESIVTSFNGVTGDVNTSGLSLHVAGISSDGGATFGDDVVVDGTISVGSDIFSSVGSGTPKISFSTTGGSTIRLRPTGSTALTVNNSSVEIPSNRSLVALGVSTLTGLVNTKAGISLDAAGITFPDGTYQASAASGGGGGGGGITQSIGFILDGNGSPLTTGEKLDALKQVPYGSSVLSTAAYIQDGVSGTDKTIVFSVKKASALSSAVSGITLEIGATASADQTGFTFDGIGGGINFRTLASVSNTSGSTIGAGEWIYPVITGNSGDINKLQIFMTVIPT